MMHYLIAMVWIFLGGILGDHMTLVPIAPIPKTQAGISTLASPDQIPKADAAAQSLTEASTSIAGLNDIGVETKGWVRYNGINESFLYPQSWLFHATVGKYPIVTIRKDNEAVITIDSTPLSVRPEYASIETYLNVNPHDNIADAELDVMNRFLAASGETILSSQMITIGNAEAARIVYIESTGDNRTITNNIFSAGDYIDEFDLSVPATSSQNADAEQVYQAILASMNLEAKQNDH